MPPGKSRRASESSGLSASSTSAPKVEWAAAKDDSGRRSSSTPASSASRPMGVKRARQLVIALLLGYKPKLVEVHGHAASVLEFAEQR